ncbi:putative protein of unknown function (DUF4586) [Trypanosoma vivax]|uniref:Uncharacterized protein n=1 Tax=Trypanosoma vivax (strain Y486) TaxID=1055687 RepID=G0TSZ0_TRYVY|nr:hypothetical protein TRVL_07733 [Trypanosoma vivax]KAH8605665.1 putative protein of unknown function (DUF4586) [Trypanosoma vivax]CCC47070.1 conserved hypothetical protein [Trypanosoma vivax Y486]
MSRTSAYGGLFSDPPLISTDVDPKKTDPYDKMDTIPSRYLGKGLTIGQCPSGNGPEVFFDKKYLTLASFEQNNRKDLGPFEDAITRARREAVESKKRNVSNNEFMPPSFPKWSDGPGSYSGCFQNKPYEFIMPGEEGPKSKSRRRRKKKDADADSKSQTSLPNVKTNPTKKGTYGFPGLLLDNPKYNENWRQEYEKWEAEQAKKARKNPPPKPLGPFFKIPGALHDFLDEFPATGVSRVYQFVPVEEKSSKRKRHAKPKAAPPVFTQDKPMSFIWSRSGEAGNFGAFPNTWIDVEAKEIEEKKKARRRKVKTEYVPGPPKGATGIWRPNTFGSSSVVQSCLRQFY